ncbi:hypothetical protein [Siminovitchia fordii]|nr:hypothetical protein [Siminovitchia fordii]
MAVELGTVCRLSVIENGQESAAVKTELGYMMKGVNNHRIHSKAVETFV